MKAYFFNAKNPIFTIELLATFKLAYDSNKIHEGAVMWVLLHFVMNALANALNSHKCAENRFAPLILFVRNEEH